MRNHIFLEFTKAAVDSVAKNSMDRVIGLGTKNCKIYRKLGTRFRKVFEVSARIIFREKTLSTENLATLSTSPRKTLSTVKNIFEIASPDDLIE